MRRLALGLGIVACAGAVALAIDPVEPGSTGAQLYDGLDTVQREIDTSSPEAQRWFNQGLALVYGFNHAEAARAFQEAAALDPEAPMPWWGLALTYGMNINDPMMTEERWKAGYEASQAALERLEGAPDMERALVEAVATRYTWPAPEDQRPYDEAYAAAMRVVWLGSDGDPDIGALFAESLMDLQPWDYWTPERMPKDNNEEFIGVIESILAEYPDHPGASHLYIHAMEAGPTPEKAEPYADRLQSRVPGAGHLVHMPSHIYARVGRYHDAAESNVKAVAADKALFAVCPPPELYWIYYGHNQHFLAFAAMMEGRYEPALQAALELKQDMPTEAVLAFQPLIEGLMTTDYHTMIRFGKWEEILAQPEPGEEWLVSRAVHHYARGIALSALGRTSEVPAEIEAFEVAAAAVPGDWYQFNNKMEDVFPIARAMLAGELAFREGRLDDAWEALDEGIAAEDLLIYDEPPAWMIPVRHAKGALMMSAGEYAAAEQLYIQDQELHPGNTWSLLGLQQSLEAQGRFEEAAAITPQLEKAWNRVEKTERPTSSCMCQPGKS